MNKIMIYIRAFFSLGWLGLIIGLMALAMLVAAFSQSSIPFDAAIERMFVLGELESSVALDLAEKQVQESLEFFSLSYGLPSSGAAEKALQAEERISETMAWLEAQESFRGDDEYYISDLALEVDEFNQFRATHREDFEYVVEFGDELEYEDVYTLEENNETLTFMLRSIIIGVEQDRQRALSDFPEDVNGSLWMIVMALAAPALPGLAWLPGHCFWRFARSAICAIPLPASAAMSIVPCQPAGGRCGRQPRQGARRTGERRTIPQPGRQAGNRRPSPSRSTSRGGGA
jgi:hypothetical protein